MRFELRVVSVVEIVDCNDIVAVVEQLFCDFRRDKAGSSGYEINHERLCAKVASE